MSDADGFGFGDADGLNFGDADKFETGDGDYNTYCNVFLCSEKVFTKGTC